MRNSFILTSIISLLLTAALSYFFSPQWLWLLLLVIPYIVLGIQDLVQTKHAIRRIFPVFGRGRYLMEWLRPKMYQYFIESDTDGKPISRIQRSVVYQRAKKVVDTTPFGTQLDVYAEGYEWMNHSIAALDSHQLDHDLRVMIGGSECKQPYSASILNVSAMSFGSLSTNAVLALNGGAKIGNFAHNTGEGGISPHHLTMGGDLVYQVGTGYFGCRTKDGKFSPEAFADRVAIPNVKMIEIKLSQGAKPGHGGILPALKNTPEIAEIRGVEPFTEVLSPPYHTAFTTPIELTHLIAQMRELSGGKPIGFKLCIGHKREFIAIAKAMVETGIKPDFITIDGGEGGTGAAPMEFSNSVGMPFREALAFAYDVLAGFDLKKDIKLNASGKIINSFDLFRTIALGADFCNSARAMMLALGCIQALECNKNICPTGVATQNPQLMAGLVVSDKKVRVANYHQETVRNFVELMAAAGLEQTSLINRYHVYRRTNSNEYKTYEELFPHLLPGSLLQESSVPEYMLRDWQRANAHSFQVIHQVW
jgi:glutamate synthase domain-containing protein 2